MGELVLPPSVGPQQVVILGAGFAGLTLAGELEPLATEGRVSVTLVDRHGGPRVVLEPPSVAGLAAKDRFERDHLKGWFRP